MLGGEIKDKNKSENLNNRESELKDKDKSEEKKPDLDKRESAILSALPPGSSTPLCSHLKAECVSAHSELLLSGEGNEGRLTPKTLRLPSPALGLCHILHLRL